MKDKIEKIESEITNIKENHLSHIQDSMTSMEVNLAKTTTNVDWLMRFFWIVAGSSIGGLITGLITLMK